MQQFREEFEGHVGRPCPFERRIAFPKLVDLDEQAGRFVYYPTYRSSQPDWSAMRGREAGVAAIRRSEGGCRAIFDDTKSVDSPQAGRPSGSSSSS
jgi:hypothetical protein